jgi:hypothetical protein
LSRLRFSVARACISRAADCFVRAADFSVRAVNTIGCREDVFDGSLDLFSRRANSSGRRGEGVLRRDTDFRSGADFCVPREYFFATRVTVFVVASRPRRAGACAAAACVPLLRRSPPEDRKERPANVQSDRFAAKAGSWPRQSASNFRPAASAV